MGRDMGGSHPREITIWRQLGRQQVIVPQELSFGDVRKNNFKWIEIYFTEVLRSKLRNYCWPHSCLPISHSIYRLFGPTVNILKIHIRSDHFSSCPPLLLRPSHFISHLYCSSVLNNTSLLPALQSEWPCKKRQVRSPHCRCQWIPKWS